MRTGAAGTSSTSSTASGRHRQLTRRGVAVKPPRRRLVRRFSLGLVIAGLLMVMIPSFASGIGIPGLGDCKGDAPLPNDPRAGLGLTMKPKITNKDAQAPFKKGSDVSLESVYGTSYEWWNYDNGCVPTNKIMPSIGSGLGNMGLQISALLPSWVHSMLDAVIAPSWLAPLDKPIASATNAIAHGGWEVWLPLAVMLVAVLVFWRARGGALSGSITASVWALLVLVGVSWLIQYPVESVHMMDEGVRGGVVNVANGFAGEDNSKGSSKDQALSAVDKQMDYLVRNTQYYTWLTGALGSADSKTAKRYGPKLFEATHMTWAESKSYHSDPKGKGKKIIERKQKSFESIAKKIKDSDPSAYETFKGNKWATRIGLVVVNGLVVVVVCLFLFLACIGVLIAFAVARVLVPLAPAAGVLFMVEPARELALGVLHKVLGPLLMGPVFFAAALVLLRQDSAVMSSSIPRVLQLVWILVTSWVMWKLLRPAQHLRMRIPGLRMLTSYMMGRAGGRAAAHEANNDNDSKATSTNEPTPNRPGGGGGNVPASSRPIFTLQTAPDRTQQRALPSSGTFYSPSEDTARRPGQHRGDIPAREISGDAPIDSRRQQAPVTAGISAGQLSRSRGALKPGATVDNSHPQIVESHAPAPHRGLEAGSSTPSTTSGTQAGPAVVRGAVVADNAAPAPEIHEANLTRDKNGEQVFVIYSPDMSRQRK